MVTKIIKFILSKPTDLLAPYLTNNGQFTLTFKRFVQAIVGITVSLVVLDLILAQTRFGNFSLQSGLYYGVLFLCLTIMLLVIRPNAETSLKQMRKSENALIRTGFYLLFIGVSIISFFVQAISNLLGAISDSSEAINFETDESNEILISQKSVHQSEYLMGGRDDPPSPLDYKHW